MVNSIAKYVTVKDNENKLKAISKQDENRLAEAIILFFGTLIPLYIFIFFPFWMINFLYGDHLSEVGIYLGTLIPYLHASLCWVLHWVFTAGNHYLTPSLTILQPNITSRWMKKSDKS